MAKKASDAAAVVENIQDTGLAVFAFGKKKSDSRILNVPLSKVKVQKDFNPRKKLGSIDELVLTIKTQGLLNPPVVRSVNDDGNYTIVAGERRFKALSEIGYDTILVNYRPDLNKDDLAALAVAVAENSEDARTALSPMDRGAAYKALEDKGWTIRNIAKECGAQERDVRRCLELIKASEKIQKAVEAGRFGFKVALEIAGQDEKTQTALLKEFKDDDDEESRPSLSEIKRRIKALIKGDADAGEGDGGEDAGEGDGASGKKKGKKKGKKAATAGKIVWRGRKEVTAQLEELCYMYNEATDAEKSSPKFAELRGAIGILMWEMNDSDNPVLPDLDVNASEDPKAAQKELKRIDALISNHAKSYVPPETEADAAADKAEEESAAA